MDAADQLDGGCGEAPPPPTTTTTTTTTTTGSSSSSSSIDTATTTAGNSSSQTTTTAAAAATKSQATTTTTTPCSSSADADFEAFQAHAESIEDTTATVATTNDANDNNNKDASSNTTTNNNRHAQNNNNNNNTEDGIPAQESTTGNANARADSGGDTGATTSTTTMDHLQQQQIQRRFVSPKDFDLMKVIGMGAFGKVVQVRNKRSHQVLAMKIISKRLLRRKGDSVIENVLAERNILQRVRHPFVVTMHCSFQSREKLFIIMDFLAGGELFLRLGREGIFLEKTAAFYLAEIVSALEFLHSNGVLHRDLKPENILLGSDGHVCLTDFGLAKDFSASGTAVDDPESQRALTICGTGEYMAPEMIARMGYGRAADYWSLGCVAYEMLSGRPPFESRQGAKVLFVKIMSEKVKMPPGCSASACRLLKGLLNRNVQARLGAARSTMFEVGGVAGLKQVEFFASIDWDKLVNKQIDPPAVFSLDNDGDIQYFHDEFTQMSLPRSVIDMSTEEFLPRRVESKAFRGFSFIQDDFALPERDHVEERSYWDSIEEDGESASECASSNMMDVLEITEAPKQSVTSAGKRPPRKRKKKLVGDLPESVCSTPAASTTNTPLASAVNTPEPSEAGDVTDQLDRMELIDSTTPLANTKALPSISQQVGLLLPTRQLAGEVGQSHFVPAVKKETWQISKKHDTPSKSRPLNNLGAKSQLPGLETNPATRSTPQAARQREQNATDPWKTTKTPPKPNRVAMQTNGSMRGVAPARLDLPPKAFGPPASFPRAPTQGGVPSDARSSSSTWATNYRAPAAPKPPLPSSSDWRNHSMNHRLSEQVATTPPPSTDGPNWPSLGRTAVAGSNETPIAPPKAPSAPKGAWATKVSGKP